MTTLNRDQAPQFSGVDEAGKTHTLGDYKGQKLVVFFYPKQVRLAALLRLAI
jgi:peroxiredoxin Q/BCP